MEVPPGSYFIYCDEIVVLPRFLFSIVLPFAVHYNLWTSSQFETKICRYKTGKEKKFFVTGKQSALHYLFI